MKTENEGASEGNRKQEDEDVVTVRGKKQYVCPYVECQKRFSESGNLKTHIRTHVSL